MFTLLKGLPFFSKKNHRNKRETNGMFMLPIRKGDWDNLRIIVHFSQRPFMAFCGSIKLLLCLQLAEA